MFANATGKDTEINFLFDEFEVDSLKRKLLKNGQVIHLKPKTFDLLLTLIKHQGEVLSKNKLFDLVWENQFVEENNLTVHVAALRKALGETKNNNRFIITVPGRGYRFIGEFNQPGDDEIIIESRKIEQFVSEESDDQIVSTKSFDAKTISANGQAIAKTATNEIVIEPLNFAAVLKQTKQTPGLFNLTNRYLKPIWLISASILIIIAAFIYFTGKKNTRFNRRFTFRQCRFGSENGVSLGRNYRKSNQRAFANVKSESHRPQLGFSL